MTFYERASELVSKMTIEEKMAQMRYDAPAIERLGVPASAFEGMEIKRGKIKDDNQDLRISLQQSLNIKDMSEVKPIELVDAEARNKTNEIIK